MRLDVMLLITAILVLLAVWTEVDKVEAEAGAMISASGRNSTISNEPTQSGPRIAPLHCAARSEGVRHHLACCAKRRRVVQAREPATGIIVIDIPAVLDRADTINNPSGLIEFKRYLGQVVEVAVWTRA